MQLDVTNQDLIDMWGTENMGTTMYCPFQKDHHFNELNFQKQFKAFAIRLTNKYKNGTCQFMKLFKKGQRISLH